MASRSASGFRRRSSRISDLVRCEGEGSDDQQIDVVLPGDPGDAFCLGKKIRGGGHGWIWSGVRVQG